MKRLDCLGYGQIPKKKSTSSKASCEPSCLILSETTDGALHTQLWIDPAEELQEYFHQGEAVDVTFSVKELKVRIML
jgi:hypothetical protein